MDKKQALAHYEAAADDETYRQARMLFEKAIAEAPDAKVLLDYGYLLESHGRSLLRLAAEQYERATELDPGFDKANYQLIGARVGLLEPELVIGQYKERLAASPDDIREYRFLATAFVLAREFTQAHATISAGLRVTPDDSMLTELRGTARAGMGDPDGALVDWRRATELDPENLSPVYSSAFLLEREDRLSDAMDAWGAILAWSAARGNESDMEWPRSEIERLSALQKSEAKAGQDGEDGART